MSAEKEILDALAAVTRELAALGTSVDTLGIRVDTGFRELAALGTRVDTLGTRVDVGFRELAALGTRVDTLGTRVDVGFRDVRSDMALLRELTTEGFQRDVGARVDLADLVSRLMVVEERLGIAPRRS